METSIKPKYTVVKEETKEKKREKGVLLKYYETSQNECTNKSKGSIVNLTQKKKLVIYTLLLQHFCIFFILIIAAHKYKSS